MLHWVYKDSELGAPTEGPQVLLWIQGFCPDPGRIPNPTQTPGGIQKVDPLTLDSSTPMVWIIEPLGVLVGSAQGSGFVGCGSCCHLRYGQGFW